MMKKLCWLLLLSLLKINVTAQVAGYAHNGAVNIYYRSYGKGQPLIIINGGPGMNSEGFASLALQLSAHANTIIFDQRGTGKSAIDHPDSTNITMRLMAEDMECIRKQLHIDKWVVMGHSFGGMLAAYYATLYPEHISKLILSSSGGIDLALLTTIGDRLTATLTKTEKDSLAYWNKRINEGDTSYAASIGRGRNMAPAYLYDRKYIPIIAERLTQGSNKINNLVWQDMQSIGFDCKPKLANFKQPVLIIQGKQDVVDAQLAYTEHRVLKNSKLVFMDKCVHYGWLDRPDVYFPVIEKFMQAGSAGNQ